MALALSSPPQADLRGAHNRAAILQRFRQGGPHSRRGLVELTGVRPNTVGEIVSDLLRQGLIEEVGEAVGKRGRRRQLLDLAPGAAVLGAELFEGSVRAGVLTLRGELVDCQERGLRSPRRRDVLAALFDLLGPLARDRRVLGVGIGVAGIVDSRRGISRSAAGFEEWKDVPLAAEVERSLGLPARLSNVTDARLIGLKHAGLITPGLTAVLAVLEPGAIGCGVVADGHPLRGAVETSSELGQTRLWLGAGEKHPCLETLTSWSHLRSEIRRRGAKPPPDLDALLGSTDATHRALREEMAEALGLALANLALIIKPSRLWLAGRLAAVATMAEGITRTLRRHLLPAINEALAIDVLDHGPEDGVRGAAGLVLDSLFAVPQIRYF